MVVPLLIVYLGGLSLILIQWILVREMTTLLLGTELVVLLVSLSYFAGVSAGYSAAGWLRRSWLIPAGILTLLMHLTLPVWFRLLVATLDLLELYRMAFVILPILTLFFVPAFYSVFLPLFVDSGEGSLARLYGFELLGSTSGVLILVIVGGIGIHAVLVVYSVSLLLILWLLGAHRVFVLFLLILSVGWWAVFPVFNGWSNALMFQYLQELPEGTTTLFSTYSPYQKVDVLQTPDGARYLFLDGLEHFGSSDGSALNVILGAIPAQLAQPQSAVVIGAGSMEMERMIAEFAGHVTTVEIDPVVVQASLTYFDNVNRMSILGNRTIVIDDAKHFFATTDQHFDLVSTDTPAAFTIQTATLYSESFYRAIGEKMTSGGVLAANLTSTFEPEDVISRRITASLLQVFDEVMVVTSGAAGWSFAYASDNLPFDRAQLEEQLILHGDFDYRIYEPDAVRHIVGDAAPVTLDSMDIVLQTSADWIADRLDE